MKDTAVVLVFAFDSQPGLVHLTRRAALGEMTLCGKEVMPMVLTRRQVTCELCAAAANE